MQLQEVLPVCYAAITANWWQRLPGSFCIVCSLLCYNIYISTPCSHCSYIPHHFVCNHFCFALYSCQFLVCLLYFSPTQKNGWQHCPHNKLTLIDLKAHHHFHYGNQQMHGMHKPIKDLFLDGASCHTIWVEFLASSLGDLVNQKDACQFTPCLCHLMLSFPWHSSHCIELLQDLYIMWVFFHEEREPINASCLSIKGLGVAQTTGFFLEACIILFPCCSRSTTKDAWGIDIIIIQGCCWWRHDAFLNNSRREFKDRRRELNTNETNDWWTKQESASHLTQLTDRMKFMFMVPFVRFDSSMCRNWLPPGFLVSANPIPQIGQNGNFDAKYLQKMVQLSTNNQYLKKHMKKNFVTRTQE